MGQAISSFSSCCGNAFSSFVSCCCTEPARDTHDTDFMYRTPHQDKYQSMGSDENERPWREKVKTNEKNVVLAVNPKFSEEEIAQERSNILTNIE